VRLTDTGVECLEQSFGEELGRSLRGGPWIEYGQVAPEDLDGAER
jgi:hypothetical protein